MEIVREKDGSQWVVQPGDGATPLADREGAHTMGNVLRCLLEQPVAGDREAEYRHFTGSDLYLQQAVNYLQWAVEALERFGNPEGEE